jgi:tetratricopeptide (TPR) repeat protein
MNTSGGAGGAVSNGWNNAGSFGGYPYSYGWNNFYGGCHSGWGGWGGCGWGHCGWGGWGGWGWGWGGWGWGGCGWGGWGWGLGWGSGWTLGFGFGFSYYPTYYSDCSYPYYRCYDYYPYHYYSTIGYYPSYAAVYHSDANVTDYADVSDPYVEYTDEGGGAVLKAVGAPTSKPGGVEKEVATSPEQLVPDVFKTPLYDGFPVIATAELASKADAWMKEGRYLEAAEARRRQLLADPANPAVSMNLAVALFGAGKYELSSVALNEALDADPRALASANLVQSFGTPGALERAIILLERFVVKNPTDGSARFVLGTVDLVAGRYFAARNEFSLLKEAAPQNPHIANLLAEADKKFLESAPETR